MTLIVVCVTAGIILWTMTAYTVGSMMGYIRGVNYCTKKLEDLRR